jgi:hypothetical protein
MESKLTIVNPHIKYTRVQLIDPTNSHYLLIAAEIDHSVLPVFLYASAQKKAFIKAAKQWCSNLQKGEDIVSAVVFKASVISPGKGKLLRERKGKVQVARYDVVILIEAKSSAAIENIRQGNGYREMMNTLSEIARVTYVTAATNVRQMRPVDHSNGGVFLFNFFYADDPAQNLAVWEYSAGWFRQESGLDNSTVLLPADPGRSPYTIINHCRWDRMSDILPSLLFKKSFHSYVLANFYANKVAAMPVLYRMA